MKVVGLDGKEYSWNPLAAEVSRESSSYHTKARQILKGLFPSERILEEITLVGIKPVLYADFFLPLRRMIVEAHGEQHYEYTPRFHSTKRDFIEGQKRDRAKKQWCELNNFYYVELPHWEEENDWRNRILSFA